jgi:hypothetical protein
MNLKKKFALSNSSAMNVLILQLKSNSTRTMLLLDANSYLNVETSMQTRPNVSLKTNVVAGTKITCSTTPLECVLNQNHNVLILMENKKSELEIYDNSTELPMKYTLTAQRQMALILMIVISMKLTLQKLTALLLMKLIIIFTLQLSSVNVANLPRL